MTRVAGDVYLTPDPLALAICRRLEEELPSPAEVIEPSAGGGAFVRAARAVWPLSLVVAVELDAQQCRSLADSAANLVVQGDWLVRSLVLAPPTRGLRRLIVGNPPYSDAQAHVEASLAVLNPGEHLAFLLRLGFLGSQRRAASLWARPGLRMVIPIAPRPGFTGNSKTDGSEYAVFVWRKGFDGRAELAPPLLWSAQVPHVASSTATAA